MDPVCQCCCSQLLSVRPLYLGSAVREAKTATRHSTKAATAKATLLRRLVIEG
jgi:hypothetical protein